MRVVHERCCGLDVHQKTVVACVVRTEADGSVQQQTRTFGTMTADLLALADWLSGLAVTAVALESTGVYWKPVFNLLEEGRTITLVNPQHIKALPGRKTDVKDSEWLADLLRHGLVKASFIPPAPVRELRELTRYRKTLVQERTQEVNRLHKVLEGANIKLATVASDVLGVSGRAMLTALTNGEHDPEALAELHAGGYGRNCRSCATPCSVRSDRISASCSGASWRTSPSLRNRWRRCRARWSGILPLLKRRSRCS